MQLEMGTWYAGFNLPFFVPKSMVKSELEKLGFTEIRFFKRDEGPDVPVNPRADSQYSDDWSEWVRAWYPGPTRTVERPGAVAWLVRAPLTKPKSPVVAQPVSKPKPNDAPASAASASSESARMSGARLAIGALLALLLLKAIQSSSASPSFSRGDDD